MCIRDRSKAKVQLYCCSQELQAASKAKAEETSAKAEKTKAEAKAEENYRKTIFLVKLEFSNLLS